MCNMCCYMRKKDSENCVKNDFMNIFLLSIACYNKKVNFLIDILSSLFFYYFKYVNFAIYRKDNKFKN